MSSSSRSISRRKVLAATVSGLGAAISGCTGDDRSSTADGSHTEHEVSEGGTRIDSTHDYESIQLRAEDDNRFVFQTEDEAPDPTADEDDNTPAFRRSIVFVTDVDEADALWIEAEEDVEAELRSFVEDTDFATQTIAIDQRQIEDCYQRRLLGVRAEDGEFRTGYCQQLKDPETACAADKEVMEAVVIRVERTYEETPSSRASSEGMSCRGPIVREGHGREDAAATESNASNATAEGDDR